MGKFSKRVEDTTIVLKLTKKPSPSKGLHKVSRIDKDMRRLVVQGLTPEEETTSPIQLVSSGSNDSGYVSMCGQSIDDPIVIDDDEEKELCVQSIDKLSISQRRPHAKQLDKLIIVPPRRVYWNSVDYHNKMQSGGEVSEEDQKMHPLKYMVKTPEVIDLTDYPTPVDSCDDNVFIDEGPKFEYKVLDFNSDYTQVIN